MKKNNSNFKFKRNQNGVALAIGIILLLVISVIGVNSMKSALLQEKMAGGLINRNYADAAAYSLLITIENFLYNTYATNNGTEGLTCAPYCGDDPRGDEAHDFLTKKNMNDGMVYPGATSHLSPLLPYIGGEPRFIINTTQERTPVGGGGGGGNYAATVGESGGGSTGSTGGNAGESTNETTMEYYVLATKARDITGSYYVAYESVYSMRTN